MNDTYKYLLASAVLPLLLALASCSTGVDGVVPPEDPPIELSFGSVENPTTLGPGESVTFSVYYEGDALDLTECHIEDANGELPEGDESGVTSNTSTECTYTAPDSTSGTNELNIVATIANEDPVLEATLGIVLDFPDVLDLLDLTFNSPDGYVLKDILTDEPTWNFLALSADGNIYLACFSNYENVDHFTIWSVDPNGNTRTDFGDNGIVFGGEICTDRHGGIVIDAEGNIYIGTQCERETGFGRTSYGMIYKYNSSGELVASTNVGDIPDADVQSAYMDSDGNIYLFGSVVGGDAGIWKFKPDLTLDDTFGTGGKTYYDPGADAYSTIEEMVIGGDGGIYTIGDYEYEDTDGKYVQILKFTPAGELDPSFGDGGSFIYPERTDGRVTILLDDDGYLYVGILKDHYNTTFIDKFASSGARVTSFGTNGRYTPAEDTYIYQLAFESGGDLLVLEAITDGVSTFESILVALDRTTGEIDASLFDDGTYIFPISTLWFMDIAIDGTGRILLSGADINSWLGITELPAELTMVISRLISPR